MTRGFRHEQVDNGTQLVHVLLTELPPTQLPHGRVLDGWTCARRTGRRRHARNRIEKVESINAGLSPAMRKDGLVVHSALVGPAPSGFYLQCPCLDSSNSANSAKGVCSLLMGKCSPPVPRFPGPHAPAVVCRCELGSAPPPWFRTLNALLLRHRGSCSALVRSVSL